MPTYSAEVNLASGAAGAYVDGCPNCIGTYLRPVSLTSETGDGVTASYHHHRCGTRWRTGWAKRRG